MPNCVKALSTTQLYEASGNVFWLDTFATSFAEEAVPDPQCTWEKLLQAELLWSSEVLESSSPTEQHRRFHFPTYFVSAVPTLGAVHPEAKSFRNLPLFAGHAILWSWFLALHRAMVQGERHKVIRLFEAGLTATIRLRLTTKLSTCMLDGHLWSENIRVTHASAVDSVIGFCDRLRAISALGVAEGKNPTVNQFHSALTQLKITYQGRPIARSAAAALLAVLPPLHRGPFRDSLSLLAESHPKLVEEVTKWQRVCNVVAKLHTQRCNEFLGVVCQALLFALRRGEITEADVTVQYLVGGRDAHDGFAQTTCVKQACVDWVTESLVLARELSPGAVYLQEVHDRVLRALGTPVSVMQHFHKATARVLDEDAEAPTEAAVVQQTAFLSWQKDLHHEVSRLLATFLYRLHVGLYDEERATTVSEPHAASGKPDAVHLIFVSDSVSAPCCV